MRSVPTFRPTTPADLDRVLSCTVDEPVSWADPERYRSMLDSGAYRAEHTWIAEDADGRLLARAVWWTFPEGDRPLALDCVWTAPGVDDRVALAAGLLTAAHGAFRTAGWELPEWHLFLAPDWRADPAVTAALEWRLAAAVASGLRGQLERYRYEWTPGRPVPTASGRLVFSAEPDDEVFVELFRRTAEGSIDDDTRRGLARLGAEGQARETLDGYLRMPGDRSWWLTAHTPGGEPVGFAMPSANQAGPVVGYLGVLPPMRGRGYADELLGEITRFHAARGAERIAADTDADNAPMAAAFDRAGYHRFGVRLVLTEG
ncbi:GNAT family N-acetyltransferase [Kitasatospora sp. NPDC096147]|uniref:GNAT family N-acetyltransferase n=1 Tax=Kitasatospora sp. NPDC096147 TaxID=3364093 RepID=UPI00380D9A64